MRVVTGDWALKAGALTLCVEFSLFAMKNTRPESNDGKWLPNSKLFPELVLPTVLPDGNGGFVPCPELLTEEELIHFLRIPQITSAKDYHNVVENLKRLRQLPRIHICNKTLYPKKAIEKWIEQETTTEK